MKCLIMWFVYRICEEKENKEEKEERLEGQGKEEEEDIYIYFLLIND